MKAFISYSSKQDKYSKQVKTFLQSLDIPAFVANDDLRIASDWKKTIVHELGLCSIFIPLLSKEFKESNWCSQELGISFIKRKSIIPISLDGTSSYGFINHLQSKKIEHNDLEIIVAEGLLIQKNDNRINGIIKLLQSSGTFRYAEKVFGVIEPYFKKLTNDEVNKIITTTIDNNQIYGASDCLNRLIPKLISIRKDDINKQLLQKLNRKMESMK